MKRRQNTVGRAGFVLILLAVLAGTVSAGGGSQAASSGSAQKKYTMKLAHDANTTSAFHLSAQELERIIEDRTKGAVDVQIYPAQQLGSSREMIEGMQMGTVEATLLPSAKYGGFNEVLTIVDMPFLFPNEDALYAILNDELGDKVMAALPQIGIIGCAFYGNGFKAITCNKKEIRSPGDLAGLKIRTMEAPLIMSMYKAWGANPVPIDFTEVYSSLQQNVVDGQENPYLTIADMKFYEVQKYMSITNHSYLSYFLSFSKDWLDSLPADLREIVFQAGKEVVKFHRTQMDRLTEGYLNTIKSSKIQIYSLTEPERQVFLNASKSVYNEYRNIIGGELLDAVSAAAAKF